MLDKFNSLSIKHKIYAGFGLMIALAMVVGSTAIIKALGVSGEFSTVGTMSRNALLAAKVDTGMANTLLNTHAFIATRDEKALKATRGFLAETRAGIETARTGIDNAESAELISRIAAALIEYESGLEKVVGLFAERERIVAEELESVAEQTWKQISSISEEAGNRGMSFEASILGTANRHFLLAHLNVSRFLMSSDTKDIDQANKELKLASASMDELLQVVTEESMFKMVEKVAPLMTKYTKAVEKVASITADRNVIRDNTITDRGNAISGWAGEIADKVSTEQQAISNEARASVDTTVFVVVGVTLVCALAGVLFAWLIARGIVAPIGAMTGAMDRLAGGDTESEIPARDRKDEIGRMAVAVQVFKDNMIENERLQEEQEKAQKQETEARERAAEEERKRAEKEAEQAKAAKARAETLAEITEEFDRAVTEALIVFGSASSQMETSARAMANTAEQTTTQSNAVAAASEEASTNVQTVATATEELSSSVQEIGRQVGESAKVARNAVEEADKANEKVQSLEEAAQKIGEVVDLINDIASQTNLLALNATIEAARAGEAGKGFAVVATEVKSLADQTAKATEEIAGQIAAIQGATGEAVQAISSIGTTIRSVDDIAGSIAAAVEQQGASTQEIASNIQQVAAGANEVNTNIASVSTAAKQTGTAANEVLGSARQLSEQADRLRGSVDEFLAKIRAA